MKPPEEPMERKQDVCSPSACEAAPPKNLYLKGRPALVLLPQRCESSCSLDHIQAAFLLFDDAVGEPLGDLSSRKPLRILPFEHGTRIAFQGLLKGFIVIGPCPQLFPYFRTQVQKIVVK
jgi:hypothetical protein